MANTYTQIRIHLVFAVNGRKSLIPAWMPHIFDWQRGYGGFSYSKSQTQSVISYILNQEEHHRKKSFREEYIEMLEKFEVEYDEKYLFEFYD